MGDYEQDQIAAQVEAFARLAGEALADFYRKAQEALRAVSPSEDTKEGT